ncbi:ATP-grasp domain-containing protein [Plantactinospora sp. ZYX-F-223]
MLYFGSVQRVEFYEGLRDAHVGLGLLQDEESAYTLAPSEFDHIERMPFTAGLDAICKRVEAFRRRHHLESIINVDEGLVVKWAQVCARLGLPAISPAAAIAARSKSAMRRRFAEQIGEHVSVPSRAVASAGEALDFAAVVGYPVVVKPSNLWGSYFVTRCADDATLTRAVENLLARLPAYSAEHANDGAPVEVLIEQFMPGSNHSVECLALGNEVWPTPVVDVVTGADLGGDDFHHFIRRTDTRLSPEQQREMSDLACVAVRAMDITYGVAHVEFVHGPQGPRLIEVGARPGANRAMLLSAAYGINLFAGYRDVLRGVAPTLHPTRHGAAAVVTPFPQRAGALRGYRGLNRIRELPSTSRVDLNQQPGDIVRPRQEATLAPLRIEMHADTPQQLTDDLRVVTDICGKVFHLATTDDPGDNDAT